jgi:hypothetical protein
MSICRSCGRDVGDDAGFCEYCGARVSPVQPDPGSPEVASSPAVDYWVCPRCHVENELGGAYCVSCGAGAPAATPVASIATASAGPQPPTSRRPQRRWPIAVAAFVGVVVIAVVVFTHGIGGSGGVVPSPSADASTDSPGGGTTSAQTSPSPSPSGGGELAGLKTSWKGIGARLATPFWGAFYCAGGNKQKAIEAAHVGHDAGFSTLVLWTGDYGGIGRSGDEMWVICAGPFSSMAQAQGAVDQMRADARELRARAPELDIHFGRAYAKLVE